MLLACPIVTHVCLSGPKRYDYVPEIDNWYYSRDDQTLGNLLEHELQGALGRKVEFRSLQIANKAGSE